MRIFEDFLDDVSVRDAQSAKQAAQNVPTKSDFVTNPEHYRYMLIYEVMLAQNSSRLEALKEKQLFRTINYIKYMVESLLDDYSDVFVYSGSDFFKDSHDPDIPYLNDRYLNSRFNSKPSLHNIELRFQFNPPKDWRKMFRFLMNVWHKSFGRGGDAVSDCRCFQSLTLPKKEFAVNERFDMETINNVKRMVNGKICEEELENARLSFGTLYMPADYPQGDDRMSYKGDIDELTLVKPEPFRRWIEKQPYERFYRAEEW